MRAVLVTAALALLAAAAWLWLGGGVDRLTLWAANGQREFQNAMAGALRQLRAGDAGALTLLLGLCFAYGFFHAVGPGHGKVLIGGYGVANRVAVLRLSALAVLSSLAQGVTAIGLVVGGIALFDLGRRSLVDTTEDYFAPLSYAAIGMIGLWLLYRGARKLWSTRHENDHAHDGHGEHCGDCGHRHGPTPEEAESLNSVREAVILIAAIAARPCTGALFLLIICWRMDLMAAGITGTFAMALGTASVTVAVALASVIFREGTLAGVGESRAARLVVPILELGAGLVVAAVAGQLLMRTLV